MDEKQVKIIIKGIEDKKPQDYAKKYCHPRMHSKNYPSKAVIPKEYGFFQDLRGKKPQAIRELREILRSRGITGRVSVQYAAGGLGRKRPDESKEAYRARREVCGMPEILKLDL